MNETSTAPQPKGVVAIFIDDEGRVIATANSFDTSQPAGFTLKENQMRLATARLGHAVAVAYCSPAFVRGIGSYRLTDIITDLCRNHGCKIHIETVGHEKGDDK